MNKNCQFGEGLAEYSYDISLALKYILFAVKARIRSNYSETERRMISLLSLKLFNKNGSNPINFIRQLEMYNINNLS